MKTPSVLDIIRLLPARDITRAAKALRPGEAGRLMIDHASRIFSQARDLTRDLEELAGLQAPEIVFGTDMFAAELPLGVALGRMASANSRLRVHAVLGDFEELSKAVLAGKLEFAIADTTSAERHTSKLAIEPVAEHRVFFFARQGHPLAAAAEHSLETLLVFPIASARVPHRIAMHFAKAMPSIKVDRDTGDLSPNLMVDSFTVVKAAVLSGDAIGLAPLSALEPDLRSDKLALIPFDAPWLHMSYGLFYPRKKSLSRAAQLFVTQLRQVETVLQEREQRALARMNPGRRPRKKGARARKSRSDGGATRKTAAKRSR